MSLFRRSQSSTSAINRRPAVSCVIESLENRAFFSASLKVISLTPPSAPAVHVKAPKPVKTPKVKVPKTPKAVKAPKPVKVGKAATKKTPVTVSSAGGEKHIDYGTSQFGV